MSVSFRLDAESPTGRKRAGLAYGDSGFWTTHLVKLSLAQTAEHCRSRDIVLCSSSIDLTDMPKPLPLGEVALRSNDGEGKPGRKEPLRSDGQAFCQSDTIAVPELFVSGLALSVGLAPDSSPSGGAVERSETERATVNLWKMHDRKEKNL